VELSFLSRGRSKMLIRREHSHLALTTAAVVFTVPAG
jgi:hypothetical protein